MKIFKDKKLLAVLLALSALMITIIVVHGCGLTSYEGKKLSSISIAPVNSTATAGSVTMAAQTQQQLKATGQYTDSTTTDLSTSITWSTSDASVATVSATGLVTAVASSGSCNITATSQGMTGSTQLTIKNLTLQTITISPGSASVNNGMTKQFTATGLFSDGTETIPSQDITGLVSWNSSTTSVAKIDDPQNPGLATGVSPGATDITAQWNGVTSNAAALTVLNSGVLQSIAITAASDVKVGLPPVQLTAIGTFYDIATQNTTTQDITSQVVWNSESPDNATVDSSGVVTAVYQGHAIITATNGGITGNVTLTVYATIVH